MKLTLLLFSLFFYLTAFSQNWSDDVAEIFYNKCTKCHHTGGVGPFPLTTYSEASPMAAVMFDAVNLDEMPPWPPNNDFQTYSHDRSLSPSEKTTVLNWLTNGAPEGTAARPKAPLSKSTSTSIVGLPRESRISLALISLINIVSSFYYLT